MSFLEKQELREFESFLSTPTTTVSDVTTQSILIANQRAQRNYLARVFVKLLSIHTVVSFLSLAVCHQFDMNPFNSSVSLSDYFMRFGHSACMLFCGFLFIGTSLLMARLLLHRYEFAIIRNSYPLQIFALCSLSLGVFMALGAHMSLGITVLWVIGAYIGSALPTYLLSSSPKAV